MSIRLYIDTDDQQLVFDLMGNPKQVGPGSSVSLPGDVKLNGSNLLLRQDVWSSGDARVRSQFREWSGKQTSGELALYQAQGPISSVTAV